MSYTLSDVRAYCPDYDGTGWIDFTADLSGLGSAATGAFFSGGTSTLWAASLWGPSTADPTDPTVISALNSILSSDATILAAISAAAGATIGPATALAIELVDSSGAASNGTVILGDTLTARIHTYDAEPVGPAPTTSLAITSSAAGVCTVGTISGGTSTITTVAQGVSTITVSGTSTAGTITPDATVTVTVVGPATSLTLSFVDVTGTPATTTTVGNYLVGTVVALDSSSSPGASLDSLFATSADPTIARVSALSGLQFLVYGIGAGTVAISLSGSSSAGAIGSPPSVSITVGSGTVNDAVSAGFSLIDPATGVATTTVAPGGTLDGLITAYDGSALPSAATTSLSVASTAPGVATVSGPTGLGFTITGVAPGLTYLELSGTSASASFAAPAVPVYVVSGTPGAATSISFTLFDPATGLPTTTVAMGDTLLGVITAFDASGNPGASTTSLAIASLDPALAGVTGLFGLTFAVTAVSGSGTVTIEATGTSTAGSLGPADVVVTLT